MKQKFLKAALLYISLGSLLALLQRFQRIPTKEEATIYIPVYLLIGIGFVGIGLLLVFFAGITAFVEYRERRLILQKYK